MLIFLRFYEDSLEYAGFRAGSDPESPVYSQMKSRQRSSLIKMYDSDREKKLTFSRPCLGLNERGCFHTVENLFLGVSTAACKQEDQWNIHFH